MKRQLFGDLWKVPLLLSVGLVPVVSWAEDYSLTVAGVQVTSDNADNILGTRNNNGRAQLSFDSSTSTLTLDDAFVQINDTTSFVLTGLSALNVRLVGSSSVLYLTDGSGTTAFKSTNAAAVLTLSADDATMLQPLGISVNESPGELASVISGFGSVAYEGYLYRDGQYFKNLLPPGMYNNIDEYGKTTISFSNVGYAPSETEFHYSIAYVSESLESVDDAIFDTTGQDEIQLQGPCTVTAYAKIGETTSSSIVGKLFGFSQSEMRVSPNATEVVMPAIVPAIGESDGLEVSYWVGDELIGSVSDGVLTITGTEGSTEVGANLSVMEDQPDFTIFNSDYMVDPFTLNVARLVLDASEVLPEDCTYGTYYNTEEDADVGKSLTASVVVAVTDGAIVTQAISYIPQGVPVLLERTADEAEVNDNAVADNLLQGTASSLDVTTLSSGKAYVLYNDEFVCTIRGSIPAGRCYLLLNSAADARLRIVRSGAVTGVAEIVQSPVSNTWLSLCGDRLMGKPARKGIYIHNRQKTIVK